MISVQTYKPHELRFKSIYFLSSYLAGGLYPLPDAEVDDDENEKKTEGQLPTNCTQLMKTWGQVHLQHLPPKTLREISG